MTTRSTPMLSTQLICAVCGMQARSAIHLGSHASHTHGISAKRYYELYDVHPCKACGKQIAFKYDRNQTLSRKFCSRGCNSRNQMGAGHHNWKGGSTNSAGYIRCSLFKFDKQYHELLRPMMHKTFGVLEHRAVLAMHVGRTLTARETVHHINGDKKDNRIENLELRVGPHGKGVRARDLSCPHCGKSYG